MSKVIDLTGRPQSEWYSNPNLLDNWYFADPIDQRQGYVVPPDTPYYSDTGLSAQAGTVAVYTAANYVDGVYGSVAVDDVEYYVDWAAAVRGYRTNGYGFDCIRQGNSAVLLENDGLRFVSLSGAFHKRILIPREVSLKAGLTYSASIIGKVAALDGSAYLRISSYKNETGNKIVGSVEYKFSADNVGKTDVYQATVTPEEDVSAPAIEILVGNSATDSFDIRLFAGKFELGPTQTVAHQDAGGNWVPNDPPPNRSLELAKCQRYYQLFSSADARPENLADYRPAMRANPALGTININGQTMYFADANL